MDLNLLIIGSLLILTVFGVGESIYKKFKINKLFIIICLTLLLVGQFVPNLKIKDITISISGFLLPVILCLLFMFKIRSFGFFVNFILMAFSILLLRLCFTDLQFVPNIITFITMFVLGAFMAFVSKEAYSIISASFFGFVTGNLIFELIKYNSLSNVFSNNLIFFVFLALISACVILYLKQTFNSNKKTLNKS